MSIHTPGEPREETVSQGGGVLNSFSGGDERSEPENAALPQSKADERPDGKGSAEASERGGAVPPPGAALPCLSSYNCTKEEAEQLNRLTGSHRRMAFMVAVEIEWMVREFGIERIGFFTLTFKDHVTDMGEAQRRFRSLRAHVIVKRYQRAVGVWERHKSKRIHFHLVVVLDKDIRSGADFEAFERKDYRSANEALRAEWAFWRKTCPLYRFGRHELMPVKSTAEGIARYVGKYIAKHVLYRLPEDKGARLVRFIGYKPQMRRTRCRFSWNNINGWLWRHKVAAFAARYGLTDPVQLRMHFGPHWAYRLQEQIMGQTLESVSFPSEEARKRCLEQAKPMIAARSEAQKVAGSIKGFKTVWLDDKKFDADTPVWAVPEWFGEKVRVEKPSTEQIAEAKQRATEMRFYAMRMPFVRKLPRQSCEGD